MAKLYNKIIYGGKTLLDLTADTVTPDKLAKGITAHDKSGATITGTSTKDSDTTDDTAAVAEILKGKTAEEALERIFENEEDDDVVGAIAVNLETGDFQGIENIENPELKKQLVSALNKLTEQLEDE